MSIKLIRYNIVLLANAHNPSIMSPDWLKRKELITGKPDKFINTPDISIFETKEINLILDRERLQITVNNGNRDLADSIISIAKNYVSILREIPYKALGVNVDWKCEEKESKNKIGLNINDVDMEKVLTEHDVNFGGIIYARKSQYLLKLTIKPKLDNVIYYNFNYHFDIIKDNIDSIIKNIEKFQELLKHSEKVVSRTFIS